MLVYFFCLSGGLDINGVSVYSLHHIIAGPAPTLQYVLIRHSDGVHDRGGIMSQVMKTKMGEVSFCQSSFKTSGDSIRTALNDSSGYSLRFSDHKLWILNDPV